MKKILGITLALGLAMIPFYIAQHAQEPVPLDGPPGSPTPCTTCAGDRGY